MPASPPTLDDLLTLARAVREHAYAPYSGFHVGAAVRTRDGRTFGGCNVENASYGLCNCGRRRLPTRRFRCHRGGRRYPGGSHALRRLPPGDGRIV